MTGTPALPDLLAEEAFVRRLARGLLFDEHRVDDVVQQTWLAALRHPPRGPARPWLSQVVRNLARNAIRDEHRRRTRETAAALPEAGAAGSAAVDEVLALEQRRQQVVGVLLGLPEPYRGTLLARYFENLTPRQIAVRSSLPAATVRTRLRRGLELMRESLDREPGGRRAWGLSLIPLARPERAAAVMLGLCFSGAWLVMGKVILVATALVVALLSVWFLSGEREAAPLQSSERVTAPPAVAAPVAAATSADALRDRNAVVPTAPVGASAVDLASRATVRGRLVLPGGAPAAGEPVEVIGVDGTSLLAGVAAADEGSLPSLHLPHGGTTSAADGTFAIPELWPRAIYALRAGFTGVHAVLQPLGRTPLPGEVVDIGDVVLSVRAVLRGQVVDANGAPLAGADVWAADVPPLVLHALRLDRLDAAGTGMLLLPKPNAAELNDPGAFAVRLQGFLAGDLFQGPLAPSADTVLHVVDVPPWFAHAWRGLPIARARTAADGTFRLGGVLPGSVTLMVRHAGHASGGRPRLVLQPGEDRDLGVFALAAGESCTGRVVDAAGRPVAQAEVRVASTGLLGFFGLAFCEPSVTTDGDGRFAMAGLPDARVLVAARRNPDAGWTTAGPHALGDELTLVLPQPRALSVRLATRNDLALAAAELRLQRGPFLGELSRMGLRALVPLRARTVRLADTFRIDDLDPGVYVLEVEADAHAYTATMVEVGADEPTTAVTVQLEPAAPFDLQVDDALGRPVAEAEVFAERADTPPWAKTVLPSRYGLPAWPALPHRVGRTDANGRLRVSSLPAGRAALDVLHAELGRVSAIVELPVPVAHLVLPATGSIDGQLFDQGRPADARTWHVTLVPDGDQAPTGMPQPAFHAVPAADGTFRVQHLTPGPWCVQAWPNPRLASLSDFVDFVRQNMFWGERPTNEVCISVTAGSTQHVRFDTDARRAEPGSVGGTLAGTLTIDGLPAQLQIVECTISEISLLATTDAKGSFQLERLSTGRHSIAVRVGDDGDVIWCGSLLVEPTRVTRLDLDIRMGSIEGEARLRGAAPGGPGTVHLRGQDGASISGTLDAAGRFTIERVPAGSYTITLRGADFTGSLEDVSVSPAARARVQVELHALATVRGRVELGRPLPRLIGVLLTTGDGHHYVFERLGDGGEFKFTGLEPARYDVVLVGPRFPQRHAVPGQLEIGEDGLRDVVLREGELVEKK